MAWRQSRVTLRRIDQGLEFFDRGSAPAVLSADVLGCTALVGAAPDVVFTIGFLLPNQSRLIIFDGGTVEDEGKASFI